VAARRAVWVGGWVGVVLCVRFSRFFREHFRKLRIERRAEAAQRLHSFVDSQTKTKERGARCARGHRSKVGFEPTFCKVKVKVRLCSE
jgi:hypothetical protein